MNHAFLTRLGTRSLVGFLCIWIVIMTFGQKGVIGGIRVTLLLIVVAFAAKTLPGARLRQIAKSTTVPAILAFWIGLAGTYSLTRDLIMIVFSTTLVIMLFEVTRGAFLARHNLPRRFIRGDVGFQLTWLFLAWLLISVGDLTFEKGVIERNGNVVSPTAILPEWRDLHVGVALSGGGYRAAIVHAGVLSELATLGVPITHLSSVSGGSIIAAYISVGGAPKNFVKAVADGRFRFTRDLTWIWNGFSLLTPLHIPVLDVNLLPFDGTTRTSVQANLIDRVLLGGLEAANQPGSAVPQLIVNSTDLRYGLSVGFLKSGLLLSGPATVNKVAQAHLGVPTTALDLPPAFYSYGDTIPTGNLSLAQLVAISNSFPGAFAPTEVRLSIPKEYRSKDQRINLVLSLTDGGVRDNLGVNSLLVADILSRFPSPQTPRELWIRDNLREDWKLDLIIASDGGQSPQIPEKISTLEEIFRAIDLAGLETGAERALPNGSPPKIAMLSTISTFSFSPDQIVSGVSIDAIRDAPASFFANIDLQSMAYMAKLVPDQKSMKPLIERFEIARQEWEEQAAPLPLTCVEPSTDPAARLGCARAALVKGIGVDIWQTLQTFRRSATLKDDYDCETVQDLYRFGQYLVRFHWSEIKAELSAAVKTKLKN